ncbi:hypothetical protein [Vibrio alginolyticus]|uniref:hypothetical protein n=1 Tax=Vibrio alginolyticus TaxID=663 RepID=UPI0006A7B722|nr:hypothetical protein [Vibrio alginolyticus]
MLSTNNQDVFHLINSYLKGSRQTQIQDIKSKKARNLLRGINPSSFSSTRKALSKIKKTCKYSDYKMAVTYVRSNPKFEKNDVGQFLNISCPKGMSDIERFTSTEITTQINNYEEQLLPILEAAKNILYLLKDNKLEAALESSCELADRKGASVFLIKVLSFISNRYQFLNMEDTQILSKLDYMKTKISLSKAEFVEQAVSQLSNLRISHLAVCRRINDLPDDFVGALIVKSFIHPIPSEQDEYISTLNAYLSFSLFDALLYIQMLDGVDLPFSVSKLVNSELRNEYRALSSIEFSPDTMYGEVDENSAYYYLRECFLFIEQPKALKFLSVHSHYYSDFKSARPLPITVKKMVQEYFKGLTSLEQLRYSSMQHSEINWDIYDASTCGMLENSSALVHLLALKEGRLTPEEQNLFVKLMSYTRDIGEICRPEYLETLSNSCSENILKLVTQCLVSINNKSQFSDHQLRSIIQDYCMSDFDGDLIELLKALYQISPAVTEHLILTCDETFLSTLFYMLDRPIDALQLRADMLHWFGEIMEDDIYIDRAKTLRIDIQLNKERGAIDDSRIYVDPLKYKQWFEDKMVSKLTMVLDNFMHSNNPTMLLDWSKKSNAIGSSEDLIDHLLSCYNEFCNNKVFGIASYLGRRIRHGTFKGTAITEVSSLAKSEEYHYLFEDKDFRSKFDIWLSQYESMIEDLVKTSLQIKSKRKPHGLITTDIDSPAKKASAQQLVVEILRIYSTRTGVVRLPSLIMDYCWRLAENDLAKTRKFLSEKKSSHAVFQYTPKNGNLHLRKHYSRFCQEINSVTSQKFGLMSSWFNKPSYASPTTDIYLLFKAVISEVKGNVSHFDPEVDIGDRRFSVNGGTYYVIYDALYVLIHNSAIHGKPDGVIHFFVSKPDERAAIRIQLMTELNSSYDVEKAAVKIESALNESNDDAHIVEGNSGIKKLKKLEKEGSISNIRFNANKEEKLLGFEFYFELNSRGKYDDIDS